MPALPILDLIERLQPDLVVGDYRLSLAVSAPRAGVTYAAKIDKAEAEVDFTRPADQVDRLIRDAAQRREMSANAREFALTRRWKVVFDRGCPPCSTP